jgi:hypothetical protein
MDVSNKIHKDDPAIGPNTVVEIVAGYVLIMVVTAVMFFGARGIGLKIPWEIFGGMFAVGALLTGLALRAYLQDIKRSSQ